MIKFVFCGLVLLLISYFYFAERQSVWVYRSAGEQSCEKESGQPMSELIVEMDSIGVNVLESKVEKDGKMHIQMCGADTGKLNYIRVTKENAFKLVNRGFKEKK